MTYSRAGENNKIPESAVILYWNGVQVQVHAAQSRRARGMNEGQRDAATSKGRLGGEGRGLGKRVGQGMHVVDRSWSRIRTC